MNAFKRERKEEYVLKDINLSINRNEFFVLMGYNGAGKSTLIKILMGIYHDYEGIIYVNHIDLKDINKHSYRSKLGILFQEYNKYETSIYDNLICGNLNCHKCSEKINAILKKVNLSEFCNKNEDLGYQFNEGRQISIGQWQKLALGRTLMRNADVYIFDEPNASLDLVSEEYILETIREEAINKIGIMIIHRFNSIVFNASKIVILDAGRIKEIGDHDTLLKNSDIYKKLYNI